MCVRVLHSEFIAECLPSPLCQTSLQYGLINIDVQHFDIILEVPNPVEKGVEYWHNFHNVTQF